MTVYYFCFKKIKETFFDTKYYIIKALLLLLNSLHCYFIFQIVKHF